MARSLVIIAKYLTIAFIFYSLGVMSYDIRFQLNDKLLHKDFLNHPNMLRWHRYEDAQYNKTYYFTDVAKGYGTSPNGEEYLGLFMLFGENEDVAFGNRLIKWPMNWMREDLFLRLWYRLIGKYYDPFLIDESLSNEFNTFLVLPHGEADKW